MKNKELGVKMKAFIDSQSTGPKDEWWITDRDLAHEFMTRFAAFLGIKPDLGAPSVEETGRNQIGIFD